MATQTTIAQQLVALGRTLQPNVSAQNGKLIVQQGNSRIQIPIAPAQVISQSSYLSR